MFDVSRVPFSYHGSWMSISIPAGKDKLFFRNHHFKSHDLFSIDIVDSGKVLTPVVKASASRLSLKAGGGHVEVCFEGPDSVRFRGHGVGLRLTTGGIHAYANGEGMAVFNFRKAYRRYQFEALCGRLELAGAYAAEPEDGGSAVETPTIMVMPDANGDWEFAIDEFWSSWQRPERKPFAECLVNAAAAFDAFVEPLPVVPDRLRDTQMLAAYIDWSCVVNPAGLVKRPTLFMSKNWMDSVWSWDQCFNAMALASAHPELALDQMLTEVDHQDPFGAYPDAFNDLEIHYNFSKPPVHGVALDEILRRLPSPPARTVMETLVESLGKQVDWWMTYRTRIRLRQGYGGQDAECGMRNSTSSNAALHNEAANTASGVRRPASSLEGLPYYLHGNDSGWDNSTMFAKGVPLVAPDLSALLIVQMDVLTRLSEELGWPEAAEEWAQRANTLFAGLMRELWRGDHFVARLANSGEDVESNSLIPWLPLVLGERLPADVRDHLRNGIEQHLTEWGLATERVDSPDYCADGYWQGPIWAPSTYLAVFGLDRSGHHELADEVARRFCRLCAKSGFAENFDAVTGEPLRDPAYSWTASVFLLLANRPSH